MKLYHGTTSAALPAIYRKGLQPRGKRRSIWSRGAFAAVGDLASRADAVYLTDGHALWFALQAVAIQQARARAAVVEVDVDRLNPFDLIPDEDAVAQALYRNRPDDLYKMVDKSGAGFIRSRTHDLRGHFQQSLNVLGTCAHLGAVPRHAITRVAIIDPKKAVTLCERVEAVQMVTPWYHKMTGPANRAQVRWLFGDDEIPEAGARLFTPPPDEERGAITVKVL